MKTYITFQAVEEYNGFESDGRKIVVCRAQKKAERAMELKNKFEAQKMERITRYQGRDNRPRYVTGKTLFFGNCVLAVSYIFYRNNMS